MSASPIRKRPVGSPTQAVRSRRSIASAVSQVSGTEPSAMTSVSVRQGSLPNVHHQPPPKRPPPKKEDPSASRAPTRQSPAVIVDDVDDDPLWPRENDITHRLPPITVADSRSRGLVSEVLGLRIGLPECTQPLLQSDVNPVEQYIRKQQASKRAHGKSQPSHSVVKYENVEDDTIDLDELCEDRTAEGEKTARVRLPTRTELEDLPIELSTQIIASARKSLSTHLLPILLLRRARMARQRMLVGPIADAVPALTVEQLSQRVGIMASWPKNALEEVIKRLTLRAYGPREIVVHMNEYSHEMMFLATGSVRISNKPAKHKRGGQRVRTQPINQVLTVPSTFGELNQLTEEPWAYYIRPHGGTACYFWSLKKTDFSEILETIPSHLVMNTIHMAFQRRKEAMRTNYPFGPEKVLQHPPFDSISWEFAKAIADRCTPTAVPSRFVLCTEKMVCDGMYFLRHGSLNVHHHGDDGSETVTRLAAPAVVCATELVHGSLNDATIRSATDSDLYFLSKTAFSTLVQQFPQDVDLVLAAARAQKCEEVFDNAAYYMEVLQTMPIIRDCIPNYRLRQALSLFRAKSYRPLTSVCSTSEFCDRIILLTKGVLRLGDEGAGGYSLQPGESVGWTCCVPHRWAVGVMSMHVTVEVLEISQIDLMNFLQQENTIGIAVRQSEQLMFPRAYLADSPLDISPHFPFYPISRSRKANFNEPGFSTVHMGIMAEQERREKEKRKRLQLNDPPRYRQVGNGVWIPSQKQHVK